jgi:hypothetical protein
MLKGWITAASLGLLSLLLLATPAGAAGQAQATFAGGCFWCMEHPFDEIPGVLDTTSGYTGGTVANPSYYQVSNGDTGHVEAVQVTYDPEQVSYEHCWRPSGTMSIPWMKADSSAIAAASINRQFFITAMNNRKRRSRPSRP